MTEPRNTETDTRATGRGPRPVSPGDREAPHSPGPDSRIPDTATADSTHAESSTAEVAARGANPSSAELEDRWRRAVAELDNMRKRYEQQLEQARRAERNRVSAAWLPVLDHLELAVQHAQAEPATIIAGVQAVLAQSLRVLSGLGYRRIEDVGARFDPAVHEAAQVVEDSAAEPNTVVNVLRSGYAGEQSVLRPAVVAVAGRRE
ncbi:MAG TPA: nucleotide exchange factor GrpE [Pseudonocardiaceae bacterium]|nr:nucleotide exchange factor GrpE [Pseudonocardiaceae bacterium]